MYIYVLTIVRSYALTAMRELRSLLKLSSFGDGGSNYSFALWQKQNIKQFVLLKPLILNGGWLT